MKLTRCRHWKELHKPSTQSHLRGNVVFLHPNQIVKSCHFLAVDMGLIKLEPPRSSCWGSEIHSRMCWSLSVWIVSPVSRANWTRLIALEPNSCWASNRKRARSLKRGKRERKNELREYFQSAYINNT